MPQLTPRQAPPPDYYAGNLRLMLEHVRASYADVLAPSEWQFTTAILELDSDAQRLYARLLGRKGPWIRIDKLAYQEVADLTQAVATLEAAGLVTVNGPAPADALLALLTQAERDTVFPMVACRNGTSRPANRTEWIAGCVSLFSDHQVQSRLAGSFAWVSVAHYNHVRLTHLLFFGDDRQDGSTFVLQDLGLIRYEAYRLQADGRLFPGRSELDRFRRLRRLSALSHRLREHPALASWLTEKLRAPTCSRLEQRQKDRTLNRLGQWFERAGDFDMALTSYAMSGAHPSRERRARILRKLADEDGAMALTTHMSDTPRSAEEVDFARRFGRRQRDPIETTVVPLQQVPDEPIEIYAARLLAGCGGGAFHLENSFPLALAGLAFWDVIFEDLPGAFTNPFQNGPLDLFWPDFAKVREVQIQERSRALSEPGAFARALRETYEEKVGIANRLVSWRHVTAEVLVECLRVIPSDVLLAIARHVIRWPYRTRTGFPDLLVLYEPGSYEFVEIKGPTDQLQPAQRVWFKALADMGLPARVLKFRAC